MKYVDKQKAWSVKRVKKKLSGLKQSFAKDIIGVPLWMSSQKFRNHAVKRNFVTMKFTELSFLTEISGSLDAQKFPFW